MIVAENIIMIVAITFRNHLNFGIKLSIRNWYYNKWMNQMKKVSGSEAPVLDLWEVFC